MGAVEGRRGRLIVHLGSAPEVGETYAALGEAQRRLARDTDVVVGFVEIHDRRQTAALVDGLEVMPGRTLAYLGSRFTEKDVDAVLAAGIDVITTLNMVLSLPRAAVGSGARAEAS